MRVLFCSAEVAPFAKVGGLADVAASLPKALTERGHEVRVAMPAYGMVVGDAKPDDTFKARLREGVELETRLYRQQRNGLDLMLLDPGGTFSVTQKSEHIYAFARDDYLAFSAALLQACEEGWMPDVLHANDWHMGFLPLLARQRDGWKDVATAFTIHNLAYQGAFDIDALDTLDLPRSLFAVEGVEAYGQVNFLKAGCWFADQVNTVSPTYAQEIQGEALGCGLHGLMQTLAEQGRLRGILNGIDQNVWNPATDPELAANYSAGEPSGKLECRRALLAELGLDGEPPAIAMVSRLSEQKGFDLVIEALPAMLERFSLAILATGDQWTASQLRELAEQNPGRLAFIEALDLPLARRMYAGSDLFLMPSKYEPCGLGQLIALRYGSVPVVRETGGLADTVTDGVDGFTFGPVDARAMLGALGRAHDTLKQPAIHSGLVQHGMTRDLGWSRSAAEYEAMYASPSPF